MSAPRFASVETGGLAGSAMRGGDVTERMIEANRVELCTEPFGDSTDPAILLLQGVGASMLWWEDGFCCLLADAGRFVIRYDHRDTGRSVTYEPGRPGYTGTDLVADAVGVLDGYDVPAAHVVGVSAGGAFAQLLALDFPAIMLGQSRSSIYKIHRNGRPPYSGVQDRRALPDPPPCRGSASRWRGSGS